MVRTFALPLLLSAPPTILCIKFTSHDVQGFRRKLVHPEQVKRIRHHQSIDALFLLRGGSHGDDNDKDRYNNNYYGSGSPYGNNDSQRYGDDREGYYPERRDADYYDDRGYERDYDRDDGVSTARGLITTVCTTDVFYIEISI